MADDYSTKTQTAGAVSVGGTATGEIETRGDRDWFAVELVAGRTYVIDMRGKPHGRRHAARTPICGASTMPMATSCPARPTTTTAQAVTAG